VPRTKPPAHVRGDVPDMNATQRRVALVVGIALVVAAVVGVAIAVNQGDSSDDRAKRPAASATSSSRISTTTRVTTPTTRRGGSSPTVPGSSTIPGSTGAATTVPSPWPPGTVIDPRNLTAKVIFDPPEAHFDEPMAYTATITNPNDHWTFSDFVGPAGDRVIYIGIEVGWNANGLFVIARQADPVFRHETAQGPRTGLLLAPHASQTFTGHIQGYNNLGFDEPGPNDTRYYPVAIVFKDGCCIGYSGIPAGSLPIPPPTTTAGG
jgi:hypothetical protein